MIPIGGRTRAPMMKNMALEWSKSGFQFSLCYCCHVRVKPKGLGTNGEQKRPG